MRARTLLLLLVLTSGCNQNPFGPGPQQGAVWRQPQNDPPYVAQLQELDQRNRRLDSNNSELHKQLATSLQEMQRAREENDLLKRRLKETADILESTQLAKEDAEKRVNILQASTKFRGGATITANNSLKQSLTVTNISGLDVRQDGDVIRISIPADQLFQAGSVQWQEKAATLLDQVAQAITTSYPKQLVAIEAHSDSGTLRGAANAHQLSASQALAVFQYLTEQRRIPERQLFTIAHGANQPLVSNGTAAGKEKNRRIEIVIYPETI